MKDMLRPTMEENYKFTHSCCNRLIFSGTRGNILDNGYTREAISVIPSSHADKHQKDEGEIGWIDETRGDLKVSKICTILQCS